MTERALVGGRYALGELIGSGGTAAVFRATDLRLGRSVAVKIVHAHLATQRGIVARTLAEVRTAARLDHPNIVRVLDAGVDARAGDDEPPLIWTALDLVEGVRLATLVADRGPLSIADALDVTTAVLSGLAHAHARGLVHRDMSPANVMVPYGPRGLDTTGSVVLDVGGSSAPGSGTLVAGAPSPLVRVSPHYASPELALGRAVDARADVYAVGAILHLMLTGVPPFDGDELGAVLAAHVHVRPTAPSARRAGVPRDVDALVLRALAKDASARFASADDMHVAVDRCRAALAAGRPTATRELPPVPTPWRVPRARSEPLPHPHPNPRTSPRAPTRDVATRTSGAGARTAAVVVLVVGALLMWQQLGRTEMTAPRGRTVIAAPAARPDPIAPAPAPSQTGTAAVPGPVVPELTGLPVEAATAALLDVDLQVGTIAVADGPAVAGTVLTCTPAVGARLTPRDVVDLVIATGQVVVPEVAGLDRARASAVLAAAGLVVIDRGSPGTPSGIVTGTDPAVGSRASVGGSVLLLVASASDPHGSASPTPTPHDTASPTPAPTAHDPQAMTPPGPAPARAAHLVRAGFTRMAAPGG